MFFVGGGRGGARGGAGPADGLRKSLPAGAIVFGHAVFNGNDGIFFGPIGPVGGHLKRSISGFVGLLENVLATGFVVELAGSGIERDAHLLSGLVPGGGDGFENNLYGLFV